MAIPSKPTSGGGIASGLRVTREQFSGEPMEIGYNATYLLDVLRCIPTEQVMFRLNTPLAAGVVEPVGALPEADEDLLCLIMPLRLPDTSG